MEKVLYNFGRFICCVIEGEMENEWLKSETVRKICFQMGFKNLSGYQIKIVFKSKLHNVDTLNQYISGNKSERE